MSEENRPPPFARHFPDAESMEDVHPQQLDFICDKHKAILSKNMKGCPCCPICTMERFFGVDFGSFDDQLDTDGVDFEPEPDLDWFAPENAWR